MAVQYCTIYIKYELNYTLKNSDLILSLPLIVHSSNLTYYIKYYSLTYEMGIDNI